MIGFSAANIGSKLNPSMPLPVRFASACADIHTVLCQSRSPLATRVAVRVGAALEVVAEGVGAALAAVVWAVVGALVTAGRTPVVAHPDSTSARLTNPAMRPRWGPRDWCAETRLATFMGQPSLWSHDICSQ